MKAAVAAHRQEGEVDRHSAARIVQYLDRDGKMAMVIRRYELKVVSHATQLIVDLRIKWTDNY